MNKVIDKLMQILFFLHFQAPHLDDHAQTSQTGASIRDNSVEELQVFQKAAPLFQEAIEKSGYDFKLTYQPCFVVQPPLQYERENKHWQRIFKVDR